jgi:hypothetical protein
MSFRSYITAIAIDLLKGAYTALLTLNLFYLLSYFFSFEPPQFRLIAIVDYRWIDISEPFDYFLRSILFVCLLICALCILCSHICLWAYFQDWLGDWFPQAEEVVMVTVMGFIDCEPYDVPIMLEDILTWGSCADDWI